MVLGLGFDRERWQGRYDSWPRRLTRLGHIAFFGTWLLNLGFAMTMPWLHDAGPLVAWASALLIVQVVTLLTATVITAGLTITAGVEV